MNNEQHRIFEKGLYLLSNPDKLEAANKEFRKNITPSILAVILTATAMEKGHDKDPLFKRFLIRVRNNSKRALRIANNF